MKTARILALSAAVLTLALPMFASARADDGPKVSIDFKNTSMQQVADHLAVKAGVNVVVEKGVVGEVNLRLSDVPWLEALDLAAKQVGCTVSQGEGGIHFVSTPHFSFTTKAEGVSLKQVISLLAQQSAQNVIVAPDVDAVVHFNLQDVPWQIALDTIVKTAGPFILVRDESGVHRVVRADALSEQKETKVFKLKYIQAPGEYKPKITSEFAERRDDDTGGSQDLKESFTLFKALDAVIADRGSVEYDYDSNSFIVTTTKPLLDEVGDIIRLVDVRPDQLFIDVKFVTTAHTDLINQGVRYPKGLMVSATGGSVVHKLPFNLGAGGFEDAIAVNGAGPTPTDVTDYLGGTSPYTFGVLDFSNIAPVLEFLATDSESEIVQAPQLTVLDNKTATVFVGEQIHFAEEFTTTAQSGGQSRGIREASKNSPIKVGTQLMVAPHIVPGTDEIVLSVIPTSEQLTGTSSPAVTGFERFSVGESFIDLPRLSARTIVTTMTLKDGQTAVLGGLINQTRSDTTTKIPILGDIPVLEFFFKNKQANNSVNNLYIFISVRIMRNEADMETLFAEYSVPGATLMPYKRGMKIKSIAEELKEIEAASADKPDAEPEAQATDDKASMKGPQLGGDVVGKGWEETEHGVEEFEIKE